MKITDAMWASNYNNNQDKHRYVTSINENVNSSPPGQNSLRFEDDFFKCIFMNEKLRILVLISLKFVPKDKGPIDNKSA